MSNDSPPSLLTTSRPATISGGFLLPPTSVGPNPPSEAPPPNFGLTSSDVIAFGGDLRVRSDGVFARHRDADGRPLGWEHLSAGPGGRVVARYTRGVPKGLVHTAARSAPERIVLAEGAIAAVAACVLAAASSSTIYAGLGGHWNDKVARLVVALSHRAGTKVVLVALSRHHAAGRVMQERALEDLGLLGLDPVPGVAPACGWVAALLGRRCAGGQC